MLKPMFGVVALTLLTSHTTLGATVTGGGASMPAKLYKGSADSILPINFSYAASGSGIGKTAFLMNNPMLLGATTGTVHYIGSDSILSSSELSAYSTNYRGAYGPLIQIPLAGTAVTIPYKKPDITDLNLTSAQLCDAFSGAKVTWGQLLGNPADRTPIRIVYQRGGSGATELLTRHLNSVCPTRFATNSIFTNARLPAGGALPSNWVAVQHYESVRNAVDNVSGSIGYEGPDGVDLSDNSKIARVNGLLPTLANRVIAVRSVAPPGVAADRADPSKWIPVFVNPNAGYSIVGYTNFVFGQCYKDATVAADLRAFLTQHYGGTTTNRAVADHRFVPLVASWKSAIMSAFITGTSENLAINNPSVCNGKGRP
ncbi:TPA: PstS family phosphate ABC transporter substrate-binding protein [Pseudomonas aeruginosa]|uniref:substrate-binding domain-containing protein n=1 Tax=Pseudomonas aeruginosa TaxID=287 RepID=UPI00071B2152|nr:PstS family phosphate ABC transporter substrate-binding protein [Pseudomonas aeruginosa]KSF01654.1 protein disulfide reductase [Pseudomonas aeruginosa]KSF54253.1 protein disulfide reductase [Pseudomonas aeruginosa]MBX5871221.1 PstS family phosphate ABC transporter substrate-binding protein [Pseudomonas aeruginosa]MCO1928620.1 PstS family phosphate ABC transporter substrate-binding protein [Pseudomonas aeruginosa]PBV92747.1 protein disulfide reductase [Pseudomonas aeruginosa]